MPFLSFLSINKPNRNLLFSLVIAHLLWSFSVFLLWLFGRQLEPGALWSAAFIALQLFAAAQLLLPVLLLHPEQRSRGFYICWGLLLVAAIWLSNQIPFPADWMPVLTALKSGLLLLVATLIGAALAGHIRKLWELAPICLVMAFADIASWHQGPTAVFSKQIATYYLKPEGTPPLIDMLLIKLAFPGAATGIAPAFGISDWIMVAFFAIVAHHHGINDNLIGPSGKFLAAQRRIGRYLPVSVAALYAAIIFAQASGLFIPALPMIALIMLIWFSIRKLVNRHGG